MSKYNAHLIPRHLENFDAIAELSKWAEADPQRRRCWTIQSERSIRIWLVKVRLDWADDVGRYAIDKVYPTAEEAASAALEDFRL